MLKDATRPRYKAIAIVTSYWRPGQDYQQQIVDAIRNQVKNGDIVTVSEKAISTATKNIVDEKPIEASRLAKFLARPWMQYAWGYVLGTICHLRKKTIKRFRIYPGEEGSKHKQLALRKGGLLQALMHGSEQAIDGSNLPFSYVSLPLQNSDEIADEIRDRIRNTLHVEVAVMIIDTDKSYTCLNFHFTPRPKPIHGIQSFGGVVAYILGRGLQLKTRSTPIAISGSEFDTETALQIAETANRARGYGAGRNVWDMAETFGVALSKVTWDMLDQVEHKPIVILRPSEKTHNKR